MKNTSSALLTIALFLSLTSPIFGQTEPPFVHPGGLFKQSDLDRMAYMVSHGVEPYATSFAELQSEARASFNYNVRGNESFTIVDRAGTNRGQWEDDATAAYLNAVMWGITDDIRHAEKCVEIFNSWRNITYVRGGGTEALDAGLYAWKMVEAAEIIQSTYGGWLEADKQAFKDMLVYPGYSDVGVPPSVNNSTVGSFYWRIYRGDPARHGNQDMLAYRAMITMGVFLDNRKMYDRALRYISGLPGRTDDISMPTGPSPPGSENFRNEFYIDTRYVGSTGQIANYRYNGSLEGYIYENGQCQESSRDQAHAFLGLGTMAGIADVAWNQGDDVWNLLDNRILKGFEFSSRYNTSFLSSFPDQPDPWEPTVESGEFLPGQDRTGRWFSLGINPFVAADFDRVSRGGFPDVRPVFEQAWAHFDVRMGLGDLAIWTERGRDVAIDLSGFEVNGFSLDHPGWGALCFRRPDGAAGDPITAITNGVPQYAIHSIPTTVEAENYDEFTANGQGRTYNDLSSDNSGSTYRDDGVDIVAATVGEFALTDLEQGEWTTYTCNVPELGLYRLEILYASDNDNGAITFSTSEQGAVTLPINLPSTGGVDVWETYSHSSVLFLTKGIHVFKVMISGTSNSFKLNSFAVEHLVPGDFDLDGDADDRDIEFYAGNIGVPVQGLLVRGWMDLDGDGTITIADHNLHANTLLETTAGVGTLLGDVDLDGDVDVLGDAFALIGSLGNTGTDWTSGDLNADNQTDVLGDAFLLIGNLGN